MTSDIVLFTPRQAWLRCGGVRQSRRCSFNWPGDSANSGELLTHDLDTPYAHAYASHRWCSWIHLECACHVQVERANEYKDSLGLDAETAKKATVIDGGVLPVP